MPKRKYSIVIAARLGSSRLPGKALLPLGELPMILFLIKRLKNSRLADKIILATTLLSEDDNLAAITEAEGIHVFRGDENDVIQRFVDAANYYNTEYVVRITGDCPFVDGKSLDYCLEQCNQLKSFDIASTKGQFPVGIDYEIYKSKTIETLNKENLTSEEREHLTLPIYNRPERFVIHKLYPPQSWKNISTTFTVDTEKDYLSAQDFVKSLGSIYFEIPKLLEYASYSSFQAKRINK